MEIQIKKDVYSELNNKKVLKKAKSFNIVDVMRNNEGLTLVNEDDNFYIFLSFKKKGDEGFSYFRINNPRANMAAYLELLHSLMEFFKQSEVYKQMVYN